MLTKGKLPDAERQKRQRSVVRHVKTSLPASVNLSMSLTSWEKKSGESLTNPALHPLFCVILTLGAVSVSAWSDAFQSQSKKVRQKVQYRNIDFDITNKSKSVRPI